MKRILTLLTCCFIISQTAISQTPQYAWNKVIGGYIKESAIGSDGYLYVIGSWVGVRDFDPSANTFLMTSSSNGSQEAMFFGKYTQVGDLVWVKSVISSNNPVTAAALTLDESDNIFLYFSSPDINLDIDPGTGVVNYYAGNQYVGGSYHGAYAVKFDNNGDYIWSQPVYRESYTGVVIQDIVYDGQYIYATGMSPANYYGGWVRYGDGPDCGCYLFTPSGFSATNQGFHVAWDAETGDAIPTNTGLSDTGGNSPPRIAFDDLGYRYVLLYTSYDQYAGCELRKYEPYSNLLAWSRNDVFDPDYYIEGLASFNITDMQVDLNYNIYFAGNFATSDSYDTYMLTNATPPDSLQTNGLGNYDQFLLKYDNLGYGEWAIQLANGTGYESCTAFELDESTGDVYIAGNIIGTTDFDPGPGVFNLINTLGTSSSDYCIAKYSTDGSLVFAGQFPGGESVSYIPGDIVINANSEIILSGRLQNGPIDVDLGPGVVNMTAPSSNYGAFVSYAACSGAPLQPALIMGEDVVCEGMSYTYTVSATAGATSYAWMLPLGWTGESTGTTITVYPSSNPGVIAVTANNPCGVSDVQLFEVNTYAPTVLAVASDASICEGESVVLNGQGVSYYQWNNGVINGQSFTPESTSTYTVTGTDENGCEATDQITIEVLEAPQVSAVVSDNSVCEGSFVTMNGNGAISYIWNNGVLNGVPFTPAETQVYTVTGTGINNCSASFDVEIVVYPNPTVLANASDSTLCGGGSLILYGTGADTYTWSQGVENGVQFTPSQSATYAVTGTNAFGCEGSDLIEIVVADFPEVTANASDMSICAGSSVVLFGSGAAGYAWSDNIEDGVAFSPIVTETYTVVGVDENGCSAMDEITIEVLKIQSYLPMPVQQKCAKELKLFCLVKELSILAGTMVYPTMWHSRLPQLKLIL